MRAALAAGLGLLLALGGGAGSAQATPGSGVTATTLAEWSAGGKDYVLREITVAPGGSTGWHYHDGTLYGWVASGTLTHNAADCSVDGVYDAGELVVEPAGAGNVHLGRNLGSAPVVLEVLYVLPDGAPLGNDAPDPGCGFG
ncbi:cupin domain-containing protein [Streptomyces sp. 6N223]|uniref:cupin domain-containing protein n=1 Tax=Streptomyces sp. 6N223 TaxID=3457412 RepID=UPI003FD6B11F